MHKNIFLALTIEENGKFYSWAYKTSSRNNLCSVLAGIANLVSANVCDSFSKAKDIVSAWNDTYRANGTYLFDSAF